ncbi:MULTISPECIES: hypothetical protein [Mycobacterium]|uniref:hypothetical protein n=1 Tax=Mycobacterium TaxID=1763 RepID=UPI0005EE2AD5|nr:MULTISPECIES: hypothetical protein [Mycobacterium]MCV7034831.1 hypothetical protein [Mycobacterium heckeshornense]
MTNNLDTDERTWTVTGTDTCDVHACSQPAAIIADADGHDRFCTMHTAEAAGAALSYSPFGGWYRITASHQHAGRTVLTVHPL